MVIRGFKSYRFRQFFYGVVSELPSKEWHRNGFNAGSNPVGFTNFLIGFAKDKIRWR